MRWQAVVATMGYLFGSALTVGQTPAREQLPREVTVAAIPGVVAAGARFICTNPDPTGPTESGIVPACGAMAALIERATGVKI